MKDYKVLCGEPLEAINSMETLSLFTRKTENELDLIIRENISKGFVIITGERFVIRDLTPKKRLSKVKKIIEKKDEVEHFQKHNKKGGDNALKYAKTTLRRKSKYNVEYIRERAVDKYIVIDYLLFDGKKTTKKEFIELTGMSVHRYNSIKAGHDKFKINGVLVEAKYKPRGNGILLNLYDRDEELVFEGVKQNVIADFFNITMPYIYQLLNAKKYIYQGYTMKIVRGKTGC